MKYKTVKLFDCQDFSPEAKAKFFEYTSNHHIHYGNDICIEFNLGDWHHMGKEIFREEYHKLLADLFEYLEDDIVGCDSIVIKHWW